MPDPDIRAQVLNRLRRPPAPQPEVSYTQCRDPYGTGCNKQASGRDGCCVPCTREAERRGDWETISLEEGDSND